MAHDKCGCMQGYHIWDAEYEKSSKGDRYCLCCEHYFLSDEGEENAADSAIEWPHDSKNNNPEIKPKPRPTMSKGKIVRRG